MTVAFLFYTGVADSGLRPQSANGIGVGCRAGAGRMQQKMLDTVFFS